MQMLIIFFQSGVHYGTSSMGNWPFVEAENQICKFSNQRGMHWLNGEPVLKVTLLILTPISTIFHESEGNHENVNSHRMKIPRFNVTPSLRQMAPTEQKQIQKS